MFCNKFLIFILADLAFHLLLTFQKYINQFEDSGEFLYALPRDRFNLRGRYNPYNLQVVSAQEAKAALNYFTASAHAITMVS